MCGKRQYGCDITYGTNSEFGFDYLRDNMEGAAAKGQVQGPLDFAIVDEVDFDPDRRGPHAADHPAARRTMMPPNIAATPMKSSARSSNSTSPGTRSNACVDSAKRATSRPPRAMRKKPRPSPKKEAARQAPGWKGVRLLDESEAKKEGLTQYYEVELDRKSRNHLTHEGIAAAQDFAGVGSFFYLGDNVEWPHLMEQAMRAHVVYERDKDYVVERAKRSGEDGGDHRRRIHWPQNGRAAVERGAASGRRGQGARHHQAGGRKLGNHHALQNFFKLYKSLSGMTGTALTEGEEFHKIYTLDVVSIPTNRPVIRQDNQDRMYRKEREKWDAIIDEIKLYSDAGRPVLVGTTSVEKSEKISNMLKRCKYGIQHEVLNAKQHVEPRGPHRRPGRPAVHQHAVGEVVGNVTIATNMAGRGTDIKPSPETFYDVHGAPDAEGKGKYTSSSGAAAARPSRSIQRTRRARCPGFYSSRRA